MMGKTKISAGRTGRNIVYGEPGISWHCSPSRAFWSSFGLVLFMLRDTQPCTLLPLCFPLRLSVHEVSDTAQNTLKTKQNEKLPSEREQTPAVTNT